MANLFRQVGIYSSVGQRYEPRTSARCCTTARPRRADPGEGITEAGALASWTAAATSYACTACAMLPFYIYYSMFGFQRVGDQIWARPTSARAASCSAPPRPHDARRRGLQHQDGSSHLVAATVPNCRAWDPATAGELAVIVAHGMRQMLVERRDVFFYVTVHNENVPQPSLPADAHDDLLAACTGSGRRRMRCATRARVRLLASGSMLSEALAAADLLAATTAWPPRC
jgi:pyruvate dehydrogenase E1 component